jgi:hypothetical protein
MMVIQLPLSFVRIEASMNEVAQELFSSCNECTILVASENQDVHSSYLMYEALLLDHNLSLRFLQPSILELMIPPEVMSSENVNRVVVIGNVSFIQEQQDSQLDYIVSKYNLIGVYEASVVGEIRLYNTGIASVKTPPFCINNETLCTDYESPLDALKA